MKIGSIDTTKKVAIVAEIGNNHEGQFALAEEMIGQAAESGVDVVKFQTFIPELYVSRKEAARFERLKRFQLSFEQFESLSQTATRAGVMFLSTPFDLESASFLDRIVPAFKIGSGENTFFPLLEAVAATGKPIIMSGGMLEIEALEHSVARIRAVWSRRNISQELAVLHCVSSYPTPITQASLRAIPLIASKLRTTPGYSDHVAGIDASVLSVAVGARIIEKHFTVDKNYSDFRDHQLSADPPEMAELVRRVREAEILLGDERKMLQQGERDSVTSMRRTIVAIRDLPQGHIISLQDLTWTRPSRGLAPGQEELVVGRRTNTAIEAGEPITAELLK